MYISVQSRWISVFKELTVFISIYYERELSTKVRPVMALALQGWVYIITRSSEVDLDPCLCHIQRAVGFISLPLQVEGALAVKRRCLPSHDRCVPGRNVIKQYHHHNRHQKCLLIELVERLLLDASQKPQACGIGVINTSRMWKTHNSHLPGG